MVRRQPVQTVGRSRKRQPLREQRGAPNVRPKTLPPPVGGWNARDALSAMKPQDAVTLKNWFPQQSDCITRPGFSEQCDTGEASSNVKQLIPYEYSTYSTLIACANGKFIDVTTDTPSTLGSGYASDDWSFAYLSGLVIMANGTDALKSYNGSAIASPAYTGVTLSTLSHVSVFQSRAYFVQKDTQSMWYGGVGSVAGALTEFDFSSVASIRGNLLFTTHLKGDGGDGGTDDIFLAVFEGGDVIAYTGSDPGDATNWGKLGHYRIGRPLSRLGYAELDDDVYIATERGYAKMSELSKFGDTAPERLLVSNKIQAAVTADIKSAGETIDWRMTLYPKGQMFIVTSPLSGTARRYHVQNINTNAWCEFGDFLAYSWATLGGNLYFGGSGGVVYAFDDGSTDDNGTTIRGDCQQAWQILGTPGTTKILSLVKPYFFGTLEPSISVNAGQDYGPIPLAIFTTTEETSAAAVWDEAVWDVATWSYGESVFARWYSVNAIGDAIGIRITIDVPADRVRWNQTVMLYEQGGPL